MADPKENAANLLVAAEKYDLMELKQMCEESLCVIMSLRSVLDTMMAKSTPRNCLTSARYSVTSSVTSSPVQFLNWDDFNLGAYKMHLTTS